MAYAMLTALSPYGEDADNRARLPGCIEPDARVSAGGELPPVFHTKLYDSGPRASQGPVCASRVVVGLKTAAVAASG